MGCSGTLWVVGAGAGAGVSLTALFDVLFSVWFCVALVVVFGVVLYVAAAGAVCSLTPVEVVPSSHG